MRLPFSLLTAAAIMVITMAAGSYIDLRNDEMHGRQLAISTGLEKIVRLNQELSGMLMVSVLEKNTLRSSSYSNVHAKLELTVGTVERLTRSRTFADDISALSAERRELRRIELEALKLMEMDQWSKARALLFADSYVLARKIYEINSDTAISALNGELAATANAYKEARMVSLIVRAAALGLLMWAGLMFSRRLRRELAEQERLRETISAANLRLEDMVLSRTADLEEANRKLEELSSTDSLTGLANRRRFDEVLHTEWQRTTRLSLPMAIAMIDVDQFKAYNDHFGHQAGDAVLRRIGAILQENVKRSCDLTARYGGEEFVIILPHMGLAEAMSLAETIRQAVQDEALQHTEQSLRGVVTVSIGIASGMPQTDFEADDLLREADSALYAAKRQGRNKVVGFEKKLDDA